MSYILDALRRADAQRERDPARGIHAQPAAVTPEGPQRRRLAWIAPAAALGALVVAGWAWWDREPARVAAPALPPGFVTAPAPAPAIVPVAASVSPPAPVVVERAPAAERAPVKVAAVIKAPAAAASAAAPAQPPAALAAAPATDRILAIAELPAEVQRELPKLAISGGVHSENAAQRMLIVGGQVMSEGAELAPGVVLEQIRPRNAVLRYRGFRYSVTY